jgi:hypothetical protein
MVRSLLAAGGFVALLGLASPSSPTEEARMLIERERCQSDIPVEDRFAPSFEGAGSARPVGPPESPPRGIALPAPPPALVLAVLGLAVAVTLAFLLRRLPEAAVLQAPPPPRPAERARPARPKAAGEPEQLARAGRFAEAIHALLLRALAGVEVGERPALTSREVLRAAKLDPDSRAALGELVRAVERTLFASRRAAAADYEASLAAYRRLRRA